MTEPTVFWMLAARPVEVGDVVDSVTRGAGYPMPAYVDPWRIELSVADHWSALNLASFVAGRREPPQLLQVRPRGEIRPHSGIYVEINGPIETTALEADGGWQAVGIEPFETVLGPQAQQITSAVRYIDEHVIHVDSRDCQRCENYLDLLDRQYDNAAGAMFSAADDARDALCEAGFDGFWWASCMRTGGNEVLALAGRHLLGTTARWTSRAYDQLTFSWRAAGRDPLHPDDADPPRLLPVPVEPAHRSNEA